MGIDVHLDSLFVVDLWLYMDLRVSLVHIVLFD